MKIKVTKRNIQDGVPKSYEYCPIALALRDIFGTVSVNPDKIRIIRPETGRKKFLPLPQEARNFIRLFDDGGTVKPFEFEI